MLAGVVMYGFWRERMGAQLPEEWRLLEGREVYAAGGERIGTILGFIPEDPADGTPDFLIVEKGWLFAEDYYLPVDAVVAYDDDGVRIGVSRAEAEQRGWGEVPTGVKIDREADPRVPR